MRTVYAFYANVNQQAEYVFSPYFNNKRKKVRETKGHNRFNARSISNLCVISRGINIEKKYYQNTKTFRDCHTVIFNTAHPKLNENRCMPAFNTRCLS